MKRIKAYLRRLIIRMIIEDIQTGGEMRRVVKDLTREPYRLYRKYDSTRFTSECGLASSRPVIVNSSVCRLKEVDA